jgi:hypothetical protein
MMSADNMQRTERRHITDRITKEQLRGKVCENNNLSPEQESYITC